MNALISSRNLVSSALLVGVLVSMPTAAVAGLVIALEDSDRSGAVSYGGLGGPAVGTGIRITNISGSDTPVNDGAVLTCINCVMAFETGTNTSEPTSSPGASYSWNGGGYITVIGGIPALNIADGTALLSGHFSSAEAVFGVATGLFRGFGIDTKDPALVQYFGLNSSGALDFELSMRLLGGPNLSTWSFDIEGSDPRINNAPAIPAPATVALLGIGLAGLAAVKRRKAH